MTMLWESLIKMTIATSNNRKSGPGTAHRCLKASYAATVLGVVLTLTGCAVGPHYVKPVQNVNASWSGAGTPQISDQQATESAWWKTFNDPVLEQLIQLAYQQNLTLRVAGLRIMEARAVLGIATGNQYPQVQEAFAGVRGVGLSNNTVNKPPPFTRYFASDQLGLNVAWEADFWRQYAKAVRAQKDVYLSSAADYQKTLVTLTAEVARTYVAIRTFEALIEQTRRNVSIQAESLRIADARYRNGATSELDPSQARALLESTRASIPQLEISLAQSKNALTTLLGQPTGSLQSVLQGPQAIPAAPAQVAVGIPAEVLRRRPDVRNAELLAMAQCERIGVAKADLYPHFLLSGTLGFNATQGGAQSFNLLSPASFFFAVGPQVTWQFLNYGRIKNNVRVEDARFQEVVTTYQNTVLSASQQVEDGIIGYVKALEATDLQQGAVTAARRSAELALIQYREGAADYQRVLLADQTLLQQETNLVSLRSSAATNTVSLYEALGGGWEISVGQPFVPDAIRTEMQKRTNWGNLFSTLPTTDLPTTPITPTTATPTTASPTTAPPPTR
jgi:NodT family efflux transporter outer membrane factor (OMF) lipoprotein